MGAELQTYQITAKRSELKTKANALREDARYHHGHDAYSGTISEDNGQVKIINQKMTLDEAEAYIYDHAQKWEDTLAIEIKDSKNLWLLGGCYSC